MTNLGPIVAERLRRQGFTEPLDERRDYRKLFARLQPVSPAANSRPGSPPKLVHRTTFNDGDEADKLRANRTVVKGRFLGGTIGYVLAEELSVYSNAFTRPLATLSYPQRSVLDTVRQQGPVTPRLIKEETGLLNRTIMPALHRLQQAFLVYEDQVDNDWERGWYDFPSEWPEVQIDESRWESAAQKALRRVLSALVFSTEENIRDWSGWPRRKLVGLLKLMENAGSIVPVSVSGLGQGWMLAEDYPLKSKGAPPGVYMLHRSDILVRSHTTELKRRFGNHEVMQFLLVDGQLLGAVIRHWRIRPHDVEDIVVELPARERSARQDEITQAVRWGYGPPHRTILKFNGEAI